MLCLPPRDDEFPGSLRPPGLVAFGLLAPGRHRMRIPRPRFSFAASMGMIDGIHGDAANMRPPPLPADPARFPDRDVLVIGVADLADRGLTGDQDLAHLPGLETELDVVPFPPHDLSRGARATDQLPAPSGF